MAASEIRRLCKTLVICVGSDRTNARIVYSTGAGRVCPGCGWPARDCRCLPRNAVFLKDLCKELKRTCVTGGAVAEDTIELQGDHSERLRDVLLKKGFVVKG